MEIHLSYSFGQIKTETEKNPKENTIDVQFFFQLILTSCSRYLYHRIHSLSFFLLFLILSCLFSSKPTFHLIASWKLSFYSPFPDTVSESIDNESVCSHRKHTADEMNKTLLFIVFLAKKEYIVSCFWSFNICAIVLIIIQYIDIYVIQLYS